MGLLAESLWRYATKKYDSTKKLDQASVDQIIEAARLAPTSSALQPFKVIVITNQELKEKIVPIAGGQEIVKDCSHLLVFAAWDNYTAERIDHSYQIITTVRGQEPNRYEAYTDRLKAAYIGRPAEDNFAHTARQSYIALAYAIAMAAELKVDATPMEGFNNDVLDELLDLGKEGLKSVTMLPLGYRDEENDWLVHLAKARHPKDEFIVELK